MLAVPFDEKVDRRALAQEFPSLVLRQRQFRATKDGNGLRGGLFDKFGKSIAQLGIPHVVAHTKHMRRFPQKDPIEIIWEFMNFDFNAFG